VVLLGVWGPVLILMAVLAIRETADWWHRRHQHGRHHPQPSNTQRTVTEIESRLTEEKKEAARPRRKVTVIRRTDLPTAPLPRPEHPGGS
jgi:hypothetical protein